MARRTAIPSARRHQAGAEVHAALRSLGPTQTEAKNALLATRTHVGPGATAEELVAAALQRRAQRAA